LRSRRFLLFVSIFLIFLSVNPLYASRDPREQYRKIQKEIESHKEKLEKIKRQEYSTLEEIDRVNRRLDTLLSELRKQRKRIEGINAEIKRIEQEKALTERELEKERAWLIRKLRALQRYGKGIDIMVLLTSTDDPGEIMRRWKYLERISHYEKKAIEDYSRNLEGLRQQERQLLELHERLRRDEERIRVNEANLMENKKEKETLLASIRREKSNHEKMIRELNEASKRLLDLLKEMEEKETFTARGFSGLKGRLPWPVNGRVAIPYGSQVDPRFNTPVFRNGIYIETREETVRAVSGGKVVFSDWFKGYGNLIIINHGEGYHTLYGNLSETFFKAGDIIKEMDIIGKVGESGMLNAPSLYFEVRYKGKPLNPIQWLKKGDRR
jgi:septal ring factor EnvC (AmiA/AmiB activator)